MYYMYICTSAAQEGGPPMGHGQYIKRSTYHGDAHTSPNWRVLRPIPWEYPRLGKTWNGSYEKKKTILDVYISVSIVNHILYDIYHIYRSILGLCGLTLCSSAQRLQRDDFPPSIGDFGPQGGRGPVAVGRTMNHTMHILCMFFFISL